MPIFEYHCHDCSREFEALVRSSTMPHCPACAPTHLEKKLSVFATAHVASAAAPTAAMSPCGSCGHPDGPGSCAIH